MGGTSFGKAMEKLNAALYKETGLKTQDCVDFSLPQLHDMQRLLFDARTPELDRIYHERGDTRRMAHANITSLEVEQERHAKLQAENPELAAKVRDGACHEMVMWYIHHLSASARNEIKSELVLPLLPEKQHETPVT